MATERLHILSCPGKQIIGNLLVNGELCHNRHQSCVVYKRINS